MIAVNYPSFVLELLLREFLVYMFKASQKPIFFPNSQKKNKI